MIYYGYYSHIDGMFLFGITRFLYQRRVVMILETGIMIENAITYVKQIFAADSSGHDYHHTIRVYRLAAGKCGYADCAVSSIITRCR